MDIEVRSQGQVKIVKLRGRLSLGEAVDRLRATMEDLLGSGENRLVLDLGELATVDSSGIGLFSKFLTSTKQQGGSLKLVGITKKLKDLLVITKLATVFDSYDTEAAALESYGA